MKAGGKDIAVTEENKHEYVDLMVKWKIERGMGEQIDMLIRGFTEVCIYSFFYTITYSLGHFKLVVKKEHVLSGLWRFEVVFSAILATF